jgi:anti-sigma regulatory factor (Ser/Thr protein kinase)
MEAQAAFPAELRSAAEARRFAERTLRDWGWDGLIESARLLVSELIVNAVIHAHTPAELCMRGDGSVLRVEVSDGSSLAPRRRPYSPTATTGRGLMILEAVADHWGVEIGAGTKTVWFELEATAVGHGSGAVSMSEPQASVAARPAAERQEGTT